MKVIIAGSRSGAHHHFVIPKAVRASGFDVTEVICGDARGVDQQGAAWAVREGLPVKHMPADWGAHGKVAGPIRNRAMADYADAAIVIWDGESRGSGNMVKEAKRAGIPVHEVRLCRYGLTQSSCELGYPGCACADDYLINEGKETENQDD